MQEEEYSKEALEYFNKQAQEHYAELVGKYPYTVDLPLKYYFPKSEEIVSKVRKDLWTEQEVQWDMWLNEESITFFFKSDDYAKQFKVGVKWPMTKQKIRDLPRILCIKFFAGMNKLSHLILSKLIN